MTPAALLKLISDACAEHGVSVSAFGAFAVNDSALEFRLKSRSVVRPRTVERCLTALADMPATKEAIQALRGRRGKKSERERSVAQRAIDLFGQGLSYGEIAEQLGADQTYVRRVLHNVAGSGLLAEDARAQEQIRGATDELARRCIALSQKMRDSSEGVR